MGLSWIVAAPNRSASLPVSTRSRHLDVDAVFVLEDPQGTRTRLLASHREAPSNHTELVAGENVVAADGLTRLYSHDRFWTLLAPLPLAHPGAIEFPVPQEPSAPETG